MNEQLEATYKEHGPHLIAWLKSRVGDEAPDVLQDVLARALERMDALEPVRDLGAWIWRAVRNQVVDLWRSRGRRMAAGREETSDLDDLVDEAWQEASDAMEEQELLDALAEAIQELPAAQREVIVAQVLNGETFASLSQRTGIPLETLAARKRYALVRLRRDLEDFLQE